MKEGAFTLIEMLVVVVIISIFVALLVPGFSASFEKRQLNTGIRAIMDMANLARSSSVAENRTFRIYFQTEKNSFYLASESDPLNSPGNFVPLRTEEGKSFKLPEKTFIRDAQIRGEERPPGTFYISFYKDGSSDQALIHCEDFQQRVVTIYLQPVFSICKVFPGNLTMEQIKDVKIEPIRKKKASRRRKSPEGFYTH